MSMPSSRPLMPAAQGGQTWKDAPACHHALNESIKPTYDANGRAWGWENNTSCAFLQPSDATSAKSGTTNATVVASSNASVTWIHAPR